MYIMGINFIIKGGHMLRFARKDNKFLCTCCSFNEMLSCS